MSGSLDRPNGYATRRYGKCLHEEKDCGPTVYGFHQCCPGSTEFCHEQSCCEYNGDCKLQFSDKTMQCANASWSPYINGHDQGPFCCDEGMQGVNISGGVGCLYREDTRTATYSWLSHMTWLEPLSTPGVGPTPTTDILTPVSATATSTSTSDPEPNGSNSSSDSNSGAIAGGVVGGVAGAAIIFAFLWYFIRRRRSLEQPSQESQMPMKGTSMIPSETSKFFSQPSELTGYQPLELESPNQPVPELPGIPTTR